MGASTQEAAQTMGRGLRQGMTGSVSGGQASVRAARELVSLVSREAPTPTRVHALAQIIEDEERRYENLCGDASAAHRSGYPIGRILSLVQDEDDLVEKLGYTTVVDRDQAPEMHAACLRFARAILTITGFQYPLTEANLVNKLKLWALGASDDEEEEHRLTRAGDPAGDPEAADDDAVFSDLALGGGDAANAARSALASARAAAGTPGHAVFAAAATRAAAEALRVKTYATACLAVALESEEVASSVVRGGVMGKVVTPLRASIVEGQLPEGARVVAAAAELIGSVSGVEAADQSVDAGGSGGDGGIGGTEGAEREGDGAAAGSALCSRLCAQAAPSDLLLLPERLTEARLRTVAAVGEYVECFGEALQAGALDLGLALVNGPPPRRPPGGPDDAEGGGAGAKRTEAKRHRENENAPSWPGGWPVEAAQQRGTITATPNAPGLRHLTARPAAEVALPGNPALPESLAALCSLLAHRKFAETFVDRGGVKALLALPRGPLTHHGFARCLFGVSQVTSAMERLLAPPASSAASAARSCVTAALEALEGPHDMARRNAALFLSLSFPFPVVLDAFDAAKGLRVVINMLRHAAQMVATGVAGAGAKQTAAHLCHTLRQYYRAHLHRRVQGGSGHHQHKKHGQGGAAGAGAASTVTVGPSPGHRAVDLGQVATDRNLLAASHNPAVAASLQRSQWLVMDAFVAQEGHEVMLSLMDVATGDRHFHDCVPASLAVLRMATLHPAAREALAGTVLRFPGHKTAAEALIEMAQRAAAAQDSDSLLDALHIVCNLVSPPPALAGRDSTGSVAPSSAGDGGHHSGNHHGHNLPSTSQPVTPSSGRRKKGGAGVVTNESAEVGGTSTHGGDDKQHNRLRLVANVEARLRPARRKLREAGGIRALMSLLLRGARQLPPPNDDAARALCCRALYALAQDPAIAHTLQILQVAKRLTDVLRDTHRHAVVVAEPKVATAAAAADSARLRSRSGAFGGSEEAASTALEAGAAFHRAAVELIALTAGGEARGRLSAAAASDAATAPLRRLERHAIAAATRVQYSHTELLQLIHEHLTSAGLHATAGALAGEAALGGVLGHSSRTVTAPPHDGGERDADNEAPRLTRRGSLSRRPGASAAGLFEGGSSVKSVGGFTLGLRPTDSPGGEGGGSAVVPGEEVTPARPPSRGALKKTKTALTTPAGTTAAVCHAGSKRKASTALSPQDEEKGTAMTPAVIPRRLHMKTPVSHVHAHAPSTAAIEAGGGEAGAVRHGSGLLVGATPGGRCGSGGTHMHFHGGDHWHHHHVQGHDRVGCGVRSKLDSIVTTYLRAQHRQCAVPITTCAPFSLLEPHSCPEPRHALAAPRNLHARVARREWFSRYPQGGPGGRARDRHFVFGRFRPLRAMRDEGTMLTAAAFVGGEGDRLLAGSHEGELRIFDAGTGDMLELHDAGHSMPIRTLRASPPTCVKPLALSCSATEVHLWDLATMSTGATYVFEGSCNGAFDAGGKHVVVVGEDLVGTMRLVDVRTGATAQTFTPTPLRGGGEGSLPLMYPSQRTADVCFSPGDARLVLWGNLLWDVRLPQPVRRFDRFSDGGGASFHPAGNEVIINSEVWDLRSDRLLRSVAALDGTQLSWTGSGDVAMASMRIAMDEPIGIAVRRAKHPLRSAFRTIDAADYSEISHVEVERSLINTCWDPGTDSLCATVEYDAAGDGETLVRVHEVGRLRPTEEDSDLEDEDEDGEMGADEEDNDDVELAAMHDDEDDEDDEDEDETARTARAGLRMLLGAGSASEGEEDDENPWEPSDTDVFDDDEQDEDESGGEEEEDFEDDDSDDVEDGAGDDEDEVEHPFVFVESDEDDSDDGSVLLSLGDSEDYSEEYSEDDDADSDGGDSGGGSGWLHG